MPEPPKLPPISNQPLSVLLLARDAGAPVESILTGWLSWLDARGIEYELVLVDDGSGDGTADRASALTERYPHLRVLRHDTPRGQGAALRTALAAARHPLLFYCPCHPDYRPQHLGQMLAQKVTEPEAMLEIDRVHLMGGYRAGVPVSRFWRVLGWLGRLCGRILLNYTPPPPPGTLGWRRQIGWLLARFFFGLRYRDVASPIRLLRRDILPRIPLQSDGPFAHVELLAKANFLGYLMAEEVPLDIKPPRYRGDARLWWPEARKVLRNPDFGPALLPAEPAASEPPAPATVSSADQPR